MAVRTIRRPVLVCRRASAAARSALTVAGLAGDEGWVKLLDAAAEDLDAVLHRRARAGGP
ncbi:MAG: hypothetical protein ACQSGP_23725 [Frankia sp.]